MSLVQRFTQALSRTRHRLLQALQNARAGSQQPTILEALEEGLLQADVGIDLTHELLQRLRTRLQAEGTAASVEELLQAELRALLPEVPPERFLGKPTVVLVVGVNGVGKTTTVAKLGYRWQQQGKRVLFAAADTYRAAAIEQLQQWADRLGVPCIRHQYGADPAAVAYDAVQAAQARAVDVVLIDTAGRLHTKTPLMAELEKIVRVLRKGDPAAPHETLLVLDASVGQNALQQAKEFQRHLPLTGVVMTKLDGTARGGMAVAVARVCGVPIRYVGIGEGLPDLVPFDPDAFVAGLLGQMPALSGK